MATGKVDDLIEQRKSTPAVFDFEFPSRDVRLNQTKEAVPLFFVFG